MQSTDLIQPLAMSQPIANEGEKFNIPEDATGTERASVAEGFPEITMKPLNKGGKPPRGQDCNGMFYLSTDQKVFLQNGGVITFSQEVSDLIGGYPKNAILDYIDSADVYHKVQSLIENNTNNFVENPALIDGTNWKEITFGDSGSGASLPLGAPIILDRILPFEESQGLALQGTYVYKEAIAGSRYGYPDFYQKWVDKKTAGTPTQTTLGESTITTYKSTDGLVFYDIADKPVVDAFFNTMGIADMYGVDIENERIFMPRNNWFMQLTTDTSKVNQFNEAGLPNITGKLTNFYARGNDSNDGGALSATSGGNMSLWSNGAAATAYNPEINASKSSAVYGASDTVQPPSSNKLLYYVVGNTEVETAATDVVDITTSENDTIPLFTPMYFNFKPNHPSWLKAGEQRNNAGIYEPTYNELVQCLTGTNPRNLKVIDVSNMIPGVDYSYHWKVNQTEMTFQTPTKVEFSMLDPTNTIMPVRGNGMTLGLTNGNVSFGFGRMQNAGTLVGTSSTFGAPVGTQTTGPNIFPDESGIGVVTDSSKSGLVADISGLEADTAQLYFKAANALENIEALNVGAITETLADKVDYTNTQWAVSACMPDYSAGVTVPNNTTYKALVDGYYIGNTTIASGTNSTPRVVTKIYDGSDNLLVETGSSGYDNNSGNMKYAYFIIPLPKGYSILPSLQGTVKTSTFYPLKGAN